MHLDGWGGLVWPLCGCNTSNEDWNVETGGIRQKMIYWMSDKRKKTRNSVEIPFEK